MKIANFVFASQELPLMFAKEGDALQHRRCERGHKYIRKGLLGTRPLLRVIKARA